MMPLHAPLRVKGQIPCLIQQSAGAVLTAWTPTDPRREKIIIQGQNSSQGAVNTNISQISQQEAVVLSTDRVLEGAALHCTPQGLLTSALCHRDPQERAQHGT